MARLEREHDSMRAALGRAIEMGDTNVARRLGSALRWFWYLRGYLIEGKRWLDAALGLGGGGGRERAEALTGVGVLAERLGEHAEAIIALQESVRLWGEVGDQEGMAKAVHNLARVALEHGDYEQAEALYNQGLELWRSLGDTRSVGATLHNLSLIAYSRGTTTGHLRCDGGAIQLDAAGDAVYVGRLLRSIGEILRLKGKYSNAADYYRRSMEVASTLGDRRGQSMALVNLASVERHTGDIARAEAYLREALYMDRAAGNRANAAQEPLPIAGLVGSRGELEKAVRLFVAAETLLEELEVELSKPDRIEHECDLSATRAKLPPELRSKYSSEGRDMTADQAVQYALSD